MDPVGGAPFRSPGRPRRSEGLWRHRAPFDDPLHENLAAVAPERKAGDLLFRGRVSGLINNDACLDDARVALGEQAWRKAQDEGAALDPDAALRLALDR